MTDTFEQTRVVLENKVGTVSTDIVNHYMSSEKELLKYSPRLE